MGSIQKFPDSAYNIHCVYFTSGNFYLAGFCHLEDLIPNTPLFSEQNLEDLVCKLREHKAAYESALSKAKRSQVIIGVHARPPRCEHTRDIYAPPAMSKWRALYTEELNFLKRRLCSWYAIDEQDF
jgi:hypothetical protein